MDLHPARDTILARIRAVYLGVCGDYNCSTSYGSSLVVDAHTWLLVDYMLSVFTPTASTTDYLMLKHGATGRTRSFTVSYWTMFKRLLQCSVAEFLPGRFAAEDAAKSTHSQSQLPTVRQAT